MPRRSDIKDRIALVMELAGALHRYGTPTHRLERAMTQVASRLALEGNFFCTPTAILASFGSTDQQQTRLLRVEPGDTDLEKLAGADAIMLDVAAGRVPASEARKRLAELRSAPPRYGAGLQLCCFGVVSGCAARFFGGGLTECVGAVLIGLLVGSAAWLAGRSAAFSRIFDAAAALLATLAAAVIGALVGPFGAFVSVLGGLIVLVPGLTLSVAVTELATRHWVSGTSRLVGAGVVLISMGFGVGLGAKIAELAGYPLGAETTTALPIWTEYAALLLAPLTFVVLFRAAPRDAGWIVLSGALAYGSARGGVGLLGPDMGALVAALLVGLTGNAFARSMNRPAATLILPGIILLVPGSLGFRSVSSLLQHDIMRGLDSAASAVLVAVSLSAGLLFANFLLPPRKEL